MSRDLSANSASASSAAAAAADEKFTAAAMDIAIAAANADETDDDFIMRGTAILSSDVDIPLEEHDPYLELIPKDIQKCIESAYAVCSGRIKELQQQAQRPTHPHYQYRSRQILLPNWDTIFFDLTAIQGVALRLETFCISNIQVPWSKIQHKQFRDIKENIENCILEFEKSMTGIIKLISSFDLKNAAYKYFVMQKLAGFFRDIYTEAYQTFQTVYQMYRDLFGPRPNDFNEFIAIMHRYYLVFISNQYNDAQLASIPLISSIDEKGHMVKTHASLDKYLQLLATVEQTLHAYASECTNPGTTVFAACNKFSRHSPPRNTEEKLEFLHHFFLDSIREFAPQALQRRDPLLAKLRAAVNDLTKLCSERVSFPFLVQHLSRHV